MLVFPDGSQAGTLGGGCVEAEVKRRALHCARDRRQARGLHVSPRRRLRLGRRPDLRRPHDDPRRSDLGRLFRQPAVTILPPTRSHSSERWLPGGPKPISERRSPVGGRYLFDAAGEAGRLPGRNAGVASESRPSWPRSPHGRDRPCTGGVAYLPLLPRVTAAHRRRRPRRPGGGEAGGRGRFRRLGGRRSREVRQRERFPDAERRIVGDIGDTLPRSGTDSSARTRTA